MEDEYGEEQIEIAEKVLLLIAKTMIVQGIPSIRDLVKDHVYESMIEDQCFELLLPENFIGCLKSIGINLDEREIMCLLEVLSKQTLEDCIIMEELEAIMQNV